MEKFTEKSTESLNSPEPDGKYLAFAAAAYLALTVGLFGDVLFAFGETVYSHISGDVSQYFARVRRFGFGEMLNGNLALWNPHIFSGTPFMGSFQSALFYPFNLIYLVLPLATALNVDFALHTFLTGWFTYAWVRNRGVRPIAAFYSGAIMMFCGAFTLRILAGHLTMIGAMSWAPLLLLCIDKIFDHCERKEYPAGWILLAIAATTMQMLVGHPQTLFLTGFATAVYCVLRLTTFEPRMAVIIALAPVPVFPLLIAAIQLWAGVQIGQESMRSGGVDFDFASTFSFPAENFLTLLAPGFFGDRVYSTYWGRWAFWDTSLFLGVTGFACAMYGACVGEKSSRRFASSMVVLFALIALGRYLPLFEFFHTWVPGFNQFRSPSKFMFLASLFSALLAGVGVERLLKDAKGARVASVLLLLMVVPLGLGIFWVWAAAAAHPSISPWRRMFETMVLKEGVYLAWQWGALTQEFFDDAASKCITLLAVAGASCVVVAGLFWVSARARWATYVLIALGIVEIFGFARIYRRTYDLSDNDRPELETVIAQNPGDYRILDLGEQGNNASRNHAMDMGTSAMWGYDPVMLERYGQFMAYVSGGPQGWSELAAHVMWGSDPVLVGVSLNLIDFHEDPDSGFVVCPTPFSMMRCKYIVFPDDNPQVHGGIYEAKDPAPRFLLVRDYLIMSNPALILPTLEEPSFDYTRTVILEAPPNPAPKPGAGPIQGFLEVLDSSTDHVVVRVDLPEAAILVMTDVYSESWRVTALPDSVQQEYELVPANFVARGIALEAGKHLFRIEYSPRAFELGRSVSIISLAFYISLVLLWVTRKKSRKVVEPAPAS